MSTYTSWCLFTCEENIYLGGIELSLEQGLPASLKEWKI